MVFWVGYSIGLSTGALGVVAYLVVRSRMRELRALDGQS
jgi:hypothetical protein